VQILVDLNRCQSYAQCVYASPENFSLVSEEVLEWQYSVDEAARDEVDRAVHACPVQAITVSARPKGAE
jgi:ferredoxin